MNKTIKIGVISADINTPMFNYGAILHTWAFIEYLKGQGFVNIENIDYSPEAVMNQNRLFPMMDLLTNTHKGLSFYYSKHYFQYLKKYKKIRNFVITEMQNSKEKYNYKNIAGKPLNYDLLIAEDDVIWSRKFLTISETFDKTFFLAHKNMCSTRKISYAASMGDCNYQDKDYDTLKHYLSCLEFISVRETYAAEMIKERLGLEAQWVLDAVFLLDSSHYEKIVSSRFRNQEPFVMIYLPAEDNEKLRSDAKEYAEKKQLRLVEITNRIKTKGNVIGDCGIEDFLSAIKYSEFVFTNSFHALCFALIFRKQFYVYSREYAGKIIDFVKKLDLQDRYCPGKISDICIDYSFINPVLEQYKKESREWLLNAIKKEPDR